MKKPKISGLNFKNLNIEKKDLTRWICEAMMAVAIGIAAGCIAYSLLNKEAEAKEGLTISAAVDTEETADSDTTEDSTDISDTEVTTEQEDVDVVELFSGEYASSIADWSSEEIEAAIQERSGYLDNSKYWSAISNYWENDRGVKDISCYCMYLYNTDTELYSASDFDGVPAEVIHIAKNEIYARHGYSFNDSDLFNYFMGQVWYEPTTLPADFSEDVFSETEVKNLDLLNSIDTM